MKRTYKNTDGKGNVTYVEYEVEDPVPEDDELTAEEALNIVTRGGEV